MAVDSEETIRAFLALPLAGAFEPAVRPLIEKFKAQYPEVKWVQPGQIHLTLHFFGPVDSKDSSRIFECVAPIAKTAKPLELRLKGIGAFPNMERPRVIWAGMEGDIDPLARLHKDLEARFERAGFPCEKRSFRPHLTLGRVREGKHIPAFRNPDFGPTESKKISEMVLYRSLLSPIGPTYETIQTFTLPQA